MLTVKLYTDKAVGPNWVCAWGTFGDSYSLL
jgi:hypothetical protein